MGSMLRPLIFETHTDTLMRLYIENRKTIHLPLGTIFMLLTTLLVFMFVFDHVLISASYISAFISLDIYI